MVLVDHQVEAELVGQQELVVIAVIEIGRDLRIERAVRQVDAQVAVRIVPGLRVGMLGEMVDSHCDCPSTKAKTARANASGCSMCGKWPARPIVSKRARGIAAQNARP